MPARIWNSTAITREIRRLYRQRVDISYMAMCRRRQSLVSAANNYFGSYRQAVKTAGINYDEIRLKPRWNPERIIRQIQKAHKNGQDLRWMAVLASRDELSCAAKAAIRKYKNWSKALVAAGLDPDEVSDYRHWAPKAIIRELKTRKRAGHPINSGAIQNEVPGLYRAAVRHFGSYSQALVRAGFNPDAISRRRRWSAKLVRETIRQLHRENGPLTHSMVRELDCGVLRAARMHYGSLRLAIKAAGLGQPAPKAKSKKSR